jgi:uncharacterized protein (TIGR02145 family)
MKRTKFFIMVATLVLATTTMVSQEKGTNGVVINGVKWAKTNVGAPGTCAATPESSGLFYQWGSNVGWSSSDPLTATDGDNTWRNLTETGNTWTTAKNPCPAGWRLPTQAELASLGDGTWTTVNGVSGRLFGNGDNTLFLHAAGYRYYSRGSAYGVGSGGFYWSSSVNGTLTYYMLFTSRGVYPRSYSYGRATGLSVRCVAE